MDSILLVLVIAGSFPVIKLLILTKVISPERRRYRETGEWKDTSEIFRFDIMMLRYFSPLCFLVVGTVGLIINPWVINIIDVFYIIIAGCYHYYYSSNAQLKRYDSWYSKVKAVFNN